MKRIAMIAAALSLCTVFTFAADRTKVRWFIGLGAGSDVPTLAPQKAVVDKFNASQNEIELVMEIVESNNAPNVLATELSGGNAPDIVGPVGIRGRDTFRGAWLDLDPLVKKYRFDLSKYDKSMVNFYRDAKEGLVGLPFATYPSFLYVNKELFKEAGLPLPPTKYGESYIDENGKKRTWDLATAKEVALKLTVDANGNDATDKNFDPTRIVQWGFGSQFADARAWATMFGSGSFVKADGTAQIPAHWLAGWKWIQDGMWKSHFIPNGPYGTSDALGAGDWFASGRIAMVQTHLWYAGFAKMNFDWDLAAMPSYNGKVTAKMHADTFEIPKQSKNPDAAFKVMSYLLTTAAPDLLVIYGGMPARTDLQDNFLKDFFAKRFPDRKITQQVVRDSAAFADNPSHEGYMPSFLETSTRYAKFWDKIQNDPKADLDAEAKSLLTDLTAIFKAAKK